MSRRAVALAGAAAIALVAFFAARAWHDVADAASASNSSARMIAAPAQVFSEDASGSVPIDVRLVSHDERAAALRRAQVWEAPEQPISRASLAPRTARGVVECRFRSVDLHGTTPKFNCVLDTGRDLRVKYGIRAEIPAEAAATRLLTALGFAADTVTLVERLRCFGCPPDPFMTTKVAEATHTKPLLDRVVDPDDPRDFDWVAMEQKFPARAIETDDQEGWAFFELDVIDPSQGGAPIEHVDALRLLAVFLAHWDNKAANQRLVCLTSDWQEGTPCRDPFLLLHDVGATFGPKKADLAGWRSAAIWEDRATCTISMRGLPYGGGTFPSHRVSEGGRRFLADLLTQLTEAQIGDLFAGARFDERWNFVKGRYPLSDWVHVFSARVRSIADGPRCPQ